MIINSITGAAFASSVWSAASRIVTNGVISGGTGNLRISVSTLSNFTLMAFGPNFLVNGMIAAVTPATALQTWNVWDGTNLDGGETISSTNSVKAGAGAGSSALAYRNGSAGALSINCVLGYLQVVP